MNIRRLFIPIIILLFGFQEIIQSQTYISGNITINTDWRLQYSPYIFTGDAVLGPDHTLTVQRGVVIEGNGYKLDVYGDFAAVGSDSSAIKITNLNIKVNDPSSDPPFPTVTIEYCDVEGGSILNSNDSGVLNLTHSTVKSIPYINLWNAAEYSYFNKLVFE